MFVYKPIHSLINVNRLSNRKKKSTAVFPTLRNSHSYMITVGITVRWLAATSGRVASPGRRTGASGRYTRPRFLVVGTVNAAERSVPWLGMVELVGESRQTFLQLTYKLRFPPCMAQLKQYRVVIYSRGLSQLWH